MKEPVHAPRLREALDGIRDLERLAGRAAAGRANPRELGALRDSFLRLPRIRDRASRPLVPRTTLLPHRSPFPELLTNLDLLEDLAAALAAAP